MMPDLFVMLITVQDAIQLHEMIITRFGGSPGIRDLKLLESALDQPLKAIDYGSDSERSIEYLAAVYFFHVIKNHAFVDGNKRTGLLVATTFLARNKFILEIGFDELYELALKTAESQVNKQEIAGIFKSCIRQVNLDELV